jgi:hypothetical protein
LTEINELLDTFRHLVRPSRKLIINLNGPRDYNEISDSEARMLGLCLRDLRVQNLEINLKFAVTYSN